MIDAPYISADRPGIGSDADTLPQFTLQPEMGTDGREIRAGITDRLEVNRDENDWAVKYRLIGTEKAKASVKLTYHSVELPMNFILSDHVNIGIDTLLSRDGNVYVGELNLTPNPRLTIMPTFYYDTKPRMSIFASYIPKGHNNIQLDIGFDRGKAIIGIATAIDFSGIDFSSIDFRRH